MSCRNSQISFWLCNFDIIISFNFPVELGSNPTTASTIVVWYYRITSSNLLHLNFIDCLSAENGIQLGVNYETAFSLMRFIGKVCLSHHLFCYCWLFVTASLSSSFREFWGKKICKSSANVEHFSQRSVVNVQFIQAKQRGIKNSINIFFPSDDATVFWLNYDEQTRGTASAASSRQQGMNDKQRGKVSVARRTFNFVPVTHTFNLIRILSPPSQSACSVNM